VVMSEADSMVTVSSSQSRAQAPVDDRLASRREIQKIKGLEAAYQWPG
jgi:hypothetical protein